MRMIYHTAGNWLVRGVLLVVMLLGVSGCYEQHTRVIVYPDGSGRIVMSRFFPAATVRLMTGMQSMQGGMADGIKMEEAFYSEARFKREARTLFGKGVRFVSARRVDTNGGRGSVALYAFDKVNGLALSADQLMQSAMSGMEGRGGEDDLGDDADTPDVADEAVTEDDDETARYRPGGMAYRFAFIAGPSPRLVVKSPQALRAPENQEIDDAMAQQEEMMEAQMENEAGAEESRKMLMAGGNPFQLTGRESMSEMMVKLYRGIRITMEVEVRGATATVVATHVDPLQAGRCVLLSLDGETMARDAVMAKKMSALMQMGMGGGQLIRWAGKPGIKIETRPEVAFTITPLVGR